MKKSNFLIQRNEPFSELEKEKNDLLNLEKAKCEFLKTICHGIGTPLNGIVGPIQLLKEFEMTDSMKTILLIMEKSITRLERFYRRTLLVTELSTGIYKLKLQKVNLKNEIENSILSLKQESENKIIQYNINIPDYTSVYADRKLIQRSINIVLSNAIIFSKNKGVIDINGNCDNNTIILEFNDKGEGFNDFILKKKIKPFVKVENQNDKDLGLGLYLLNLIIEAHSGKVEIHNNIYGGATVKFIFPKFSIK